MRRVYRFAWLFFVLLSKALLLVSAFQRQETTRRTTTTSLMRTPPSSRSPPGRASTQCHLVASLLAGSLAGAIGSGIAFPLDTLNIKSLQLYDDERKTEGDAAQRTRTDLWKTASAIWEEHGWAGFFSGVSGVMVGESLIKAVAYTANAVGLAYFASTLPPDDEPVKAILAAACLSGIVTSFFVAPVERVKVLMQTRQFENEWDCIKDVLQSEGIDGLFRRGLVATMVRDVPSYALYFGIYGILTDTVDLGPLSPMIFGATAGSMSWLPVYPVDLVKTAVQRGRNVNALDVIQSLYAKAGISAFFVGLTPKLLRAAVNHATTFTVYEALMQSSSFVQ